MIKIVLQSNKWHKTTTIAVRGYCFDSENNFYEGANFSQLFATVKTGNDFCRLLQNLTGIFVVVVETENRLFAASDISRVMPLFYSLEKECFTISDNPYNLLPDNPKIDKGAEEEFLLSSFTLDEKTLIEGVFQIKPACYLCFENEKITQKEYYSYCVTHSELNNSETLENKFSLRLENVFRRLIQSVQGRQIVVPLSGGYDSRLIVAMLKKLDYRNVLCYTFGRENNPEYEIAKKVAQSLGYPHHFICTGDRKFTENYTGDETFQRYYKFSGSFFNLFWMFEYFSVKYLIDTDLIESDAVFVPGHPGDFFAGSEASEFNIAHSDTQKQIVKKAAASVFLFGSPQKYSFSKISKIIHTYSDCTAYSMFENFMCATKIAKRLSNAARLYEFFGYDVRLPFWDNEIVEFFRTLPPHLKQNKTFYKNYLKNNVFKEFAINYEKELQVEHKKNPLQPLKEFVRPYTPKFIFRLLSTHRDDTCMNEITKPLLLDLKQHAIQLNTIQANEIFVRWYLMKIKEDFGFIIPKNKSV
ncbi:MAG: asparagine synthase-related protein [Bacteroidetes bacterium]|nr:asparagine synthase-related protein [Bacteroidota bacterium]